MTPEATELSDRVDAVIRPLVLEYWGSGASLRDVDLVIQNTVSSIAAETVIRAATAKRKSERAEARKTGQIQPDLYPYD